MVGEQGAEEISGAVLERLNHLSGQASLSGDLVNVGLDWESICAFQRSVRPDDRRATGHGPDGTDLPVAMGPGLGNRCECPIRRIAAAAARLLRNRSTPVG